MVERPSWLRASASELARLIRDGEASSRQVVMAHIEHAKAWNPALNAIVSDRYDAALREADEADARLRSPSPQPLGPLHGVPCTVKEAFALTGMPQSAGLVARSAYRATSDAPTVARLRAAGAIPIGVTNTSELCMWMESSNRVYGRTGNPYDPRRIAGGSSGGEGAIIGAGASPFGVGSDVGGSIRMPAFFNGIFGHKPTAGLVPNTGQFPAQEGRANPLLTTGPMCRRAEDLMPLLRIMAGPDGVDPTCTAQAIGDPAAVSLQGLRVVHVPENGLARVSRELAAAHQAVADRLADGGARVERRTFPRMRRSVEIWSARLGAIGGESFASMLGNGRPVNLWAQLPRWLVGASPHTLPALGLAILEPLSKASPARTRRFIEEGQRLREEILEAMGPGGVLLFPVYPETAPRHGLPLMTPTRWAYTAIINALELPSTSVPLGLDSRGLPLGIQIVSAPGNDHVTIAVALALERAFGGWVAPTASSACDAGSRPSR